MGVDCHSRIVIIAQGELSRQSHVIKPAKSLRDAGFEVVRLGFKWAHGEMRKEEDGIGRIVRLDRDAGPAIGVPGTPAQASTGDPEVGTKRHWAIEVLKTALFRFRTGRRIRKWVVVGRVLSSMKRDTRALVRAGRSLDPDLVICIQLDMLPAGVALARECGVPLLYDVRDLSCDSGWSHHDDPRFRRIERKLIRKADLVSAASPEMSADLASMYGIPLPIVLYNSSVARSVRVTEFAPKVRVLFQGGFRSNRCLPDLVEAMAELRDEAVLTLQGWGSMEAELKKTVRELGLEDVVKFIPIVPMDEASLAAGAHDIGIINYRGTTRNLQVTVPVKLFDYLGGGLAIAASDLPGLRSIVATADCGTLFDPSGPAAIVEVIRDLSSDRSRLVKMKQNALAVWEEYSWQRQGQKLVEAASELLLQQG